MKKILFLVPLLFLIQPAFGEIMVQNDQTYIGDDGMLHIVGEIQNNSKAILAYTLNKKSSNSQTLNEDDLLIDIYSLNDQETDTVRLDASTIKQLFEDTDYKLDDVRKKKLVKPVALLSRATE